MPVIGTFVIHVLSMHPIPSKCPAPRASLVVKSPLLRSCLSCCPVRACCSVLLPAYVKKVSTRCKPACLPAMSAHEEGEKKRPPTIGRVQWRRSSCLPKSHQCCVLSGKGGASSPFDSRQQQRRRNWKLWGIEGRNCLGIGMGTSRSLAATFEGMQAGLGEGRG